MEEAVLFKREGFALLKKPPKFLETKQNEYSHIITTVAMVIETA